MLKLGELGEVIFRIYKLGELGDLSFFSYGSIVSLKVSILFNFIPFFGQTPEFDLYAFRSKFS